MECVSDVILKRFQVSWIRKSDSAILSVDDMLVCISSISRPEIRLSVYL